MFKRKILQELYSWKNAPRKKKALVIKGLRQIGKTFIVRYFAEENYKSVIYINFKNNEDIRTVFEGNLEVNRIMLDISAKMPGIKLIPGDTILIFDEVQECANARASIKPFMEDGRYDIIAIGSLLGIRGYNRKIGKGVPTGFEHIIYMKPMDFEEFLWAIGIDETVTSYIRECYTNKKQVSKSTHLAMLRYFKEYICVGGLPKIVETFVNTKNMNEVYSIQHDILEEYRDDFGKHLNADENEETDPLLLARIEEVFSSIPNQLAKENKKFQYSKIKVKGRSSEYREAIQWLVDAGIVAQCFNLTELALPLEGNKDEDVFKLYMQDSGLYVAMLEKGTAGDILSGNLGIYKGAIFENIVADAFSKQDIKLYYFHRSSGLEIDYIIRFHGKPTLVEVKAKSGKTKSSKTVLSDKAKYEVDDLIKLGEYNVSVNDHITTLPYYMSFLLAEELATI